MPEYLKASIIGLITVFIGITMEVVGVWKARPPFWVVEENSWLLKRRGPIEPPPEAVLIAINGQVADELKQSREPSKWPRSLHAELIEKLVEREAAVIVFDIAFMDPRSDEEDNQLARAIKQAARVVLLQEIKQDRPIPGVMERYYIDGPASVFADAAMGLGPLPITKIPNGKVFRLWTFKDVGDEVPTLPAVALQLYSLPIMDRFMEILEDAGLQFDSFPQNPSDIRNSEELCGLMNFLRREFKKDPLALKRFMSALEMNGDEKLSEGERKLLAALAILYGGREFIYLNYYGPPATITTIPYDAVLDKDPFDAADQLDLKQKVVFVGSLELSGAEQIDFYPTAFSKDDGTYLSGVEIAATAFANLLSDNMFYVHMPTRLCVLLFFGLLVGILAYVVPGGRAIIVTVIVGIVYFSVAFYLFVQQSFWLPVFIPLLFQVPIALFLGLVCQYLCTKHEKEKLLLWVPEKVVNFPEAGLFHGTCLLTDIRGSREISSELSASEYKSLMMSYFSRIEKTVNRNGGYEWDTYGDGAMYIFTARQPEAPLRTAACQAALEIYRDIESFNREQSEKRKLPTRMGLHTGWMEFEEGAREKTLGDVGNTVRSIEELNKLLSTRILASAAAVEGISDYPSGKGMPHSLISHRKNNRFWMRRMGSFILKGKTAPMTIFELMDCQEGKIEAIRKQIEWFAEALDAFESQRWQKAAKIFGEILMQYHKDGPALFYIQRCQLYCENSPASEDPSIIRIEI